MKISIDTLISTYLRRPRGAVKMDGDVLINEARKSADPAMIPVLCNVVDRLAAQLAEMQKQRDALADALWCAEDQWGDDYLWKKWNLSEHLTEELKDHLTAKAKP